MTHLMDESKRPLSKAKADFLPGGLDKPRKSGVIRKDGTTAMEWKPFVQLSGKAFADRAGFQVALSGDSTTVAVGSPLNDGENGDMENAGSVTVYKRLGTIWYQMGDPIRGDQKYAQSGFSIAINFAGDHVAIGAPYYNISNADPGYEETVPYVGQVRVFSFGNEANPGDCSEGPCTGEWMQLGSMITGNEGSQLCGFSVAVGAMGRNLAIGCPRMNDHDNVRPNAGQVRVYKFDTEGIGDAEPTFDWQLKGSPVFGAETNIIAGVRVGMSGDANTMSFMAPGLSKNVKGYGRVRVFTWEENEWKQKGEPIINYDENDKRGRAMHMSRDGLNVAIGSPSKIKHRTGHVRVFSWDDDTGGWVQKGEAVPGGGSYHTVGHSVAMNTDGSKLAVGSPFNSFKGKTAGRARVYYWKDDRMKNGVLSPAWVLRGQKMDGDPGDTNGFSLAISGKGNMIAIGAPQFKHKKDKDALFFNAATQPQLDFDDEDVEPDEEYDEDEFVDEDADEDTLDEDGAPQLTLGRELVEKSDKSQLRDNSHDKRQKNRIEPKSHRSSPAVQLAQLSKTPGEDEHSYHGPNYYKKQGFGRARVQGAFECHFKGDLTPPENPY